MMLSSSQTFANAKSCKNQMATKRMLIILLIIAIISILFIDAKCLPLRWNDSVSMPIGLYRVINSPVKRGDIVAVCLPEAIAQFGLHRHYLGEAVVKQMVGVGGDTVLLISHAIKINGEPLPHSETLRRDKAERDLHAIARGAYDLSPTQLWLYGNHNAHSWDSRYYGPIDKHCIQSVLKPVLVW